MKISINLPDSKAIRQRLAATLGHSADTAFQAHNNDLGDALRDIEASIRGTIDPATLFRGPEGALAVLLDHSASSDLRLMAKEYLLEVVDQTRLDP